jgi:hypothetical protein
MLRKIRESFLFYLFFLKFHPLISQSPFDLVVAAIVIRKLLGRPTGTCNSRERKTFFPGTWTQQYEMNLFPHVFLCVFPLLGFGCRYRQAQEASNRVGREL